MWICKNISSMSLTCLSLHFPSTFFFFLPPPFFQKVGVIYPVMFEESMNTVLTMELVKFNRLLSTIKHALTETQRALVGITVMSPELEAMGNSMVRRWRDDHVCRV